MKFHPLFESYLNCSNSNEVFSYLYNTFTDSIVLWNYLVDWQKVFNNFQEIEIKLNLINYLIGKENIENEARFLFQKYPDLVTIIPILLASRSLEFKILTDYYQGDLIYQIFNFETKNCLTTAELDKVIEFIKKTGLLELLKSRKIKNIPDYVFGIEVGLDSNGRKNRAGTTMETIVESLLEPICQEQNFSLMLQATASKLKKEWEVDLKVDKSSRRFDFAIKTHNTMYLIETNFYGGGGSKLKSTAGEYRTLFDYISSHNYKFIWITDGLGWKSTKRPLEETFNYIDYIFNLKMTTTGLLADILSKEL